MTKPPVPTEDLSHLTGMHVVTVIRHAGDLKSAKTADGIIVKREDKLWMGEEFGWVKCAPYSRHFLFLDPLFEKRIGRWNPCCTCGGMAGIVGANVYAKDASPSTSQESTMPGAMIVCISHANTGKHADGSSET